MHAERLDDLRELIGEYWSLAFAEGQEGRDTDTPDGAAQKCLSAIESIIREARAALTPPDCSDQNLLELAATFETCIAFLPPVGRRNIAKAVDQLRYKGMTTAEGHVVVTRNEAGQAVAVTRQDDEGRILSVIAEFEHHPSVPVATLAALADRWASDRNYTGSPVDDIRALIDEPTAARPEVKP